MIVRTRPNLLTLLFTLRGSIVPRVAPKLAGIVAVSCAVVWAESRWPALFPVSAGVTPFTVVGLALSIFLSFRNNACYERWWEARKHWGNLIGEVRNLARALPALLPEREAALQLRRLSAFAHGLHARLRDLDEAAAVDRTSPGSDLSGPNPTDSVLAAITRDLAALTRAGRLSDIQFGILEARIEALSGVHTACERLANTPLPFAYTLLVYRTAWLYCLLLPVGLTGSLGWATPVVVALVAYTFFGLDALGDELEEPFGTEPNDLPLDAMVRAVDRIVHHALGEPMPQALAPDGYWLR
ncbi:MULTISPECIES: bestrophin family protein [Methylobacterium]|uniref:bestrophin family protein n=1 Tax=Methylobacterium TaxID=407 RepID=UPI0008EB5F8A|nr:MULTISPECIES: bestrophin family protein [unclassified Methylobacterium]SFD62614.1 putative membrane protein [Methylobacterium sp. 13MFTsu3.1M2]SFT12120.1 putative membrane protein [Methylobacterium sp. yr668]